MVAERARGVAIGNTELRAAMLLVRTPMLGVVKGARMRVMPQPTTLKPNPLIPLLFTVHWRWYLKREESRVSYSTEQSDKVHVRPV